MTPTDARARLTSSRDGTTMVTFYGGNGYDGHALLDEESARRLRDDLNDCLTGLHTSAMCERLLVGRGDDTYDPVCGLPRGHADVCVPARFEGSE